MVFRHAGNTSLPVGNDHRCTGSRSKSILPEPGPDKGDLITNKTATSFLMVLSQIGNYTFFRTAVRPILGLRYRPGNRRNNRERHRQKIPFPYGEPYIQKVLARPDGRQRGPIAAWPTKGSARDFASILNGFHSEAVILNCLS